jgi:hypothetical protein
MKKFIYAIILIIPFHLLFAVVPDQKNMGFLLSENRKNMEFIDVVLSNLTPVNEKTEDNSKVAEKYDYQSDYNKLHKANKLSFEGNSFYLRGDYLSAFEPLRNAQKSLVSLFSSSIDKHIKETTNLIEYLEVKVWKMDDRFAKHFMSKAIRELRMAENTKLRSDNISPHHFRNKILLCQEALLYSRNARKIALVALLEYKTVDEDKREYKKVTFDDALSKIPSNTKDDYESFKQKLIYAIENKKLDRIVASPMREGAEKLDVMEIHDDNYGIITYQRSSLLDKSDLDLSFETPSPTDGTDFPENTNTDTKPLPE